MDIRGGAASKEETFTILMIAIFMIALFSVNATEASSKNVSTIHANGKIIGVSEKITYLIRTLDSEVYQAINGTDGSIVLSSADVGNIANSLVSDNVRIVFDSGTFILKQPISKLANNVIIEGQGEGTLLQVADKGTDTFTLSNVNSWLIQNLKINQSNTGIHATNCSNLRIVNNVINNSYGNAITILKSTYCTVVNNIIYNSINGFAIQFWNTSNSKIVNNTADFTYWSVITVSDGSNYNVVDRNMVSRGGQNGTLGDGIEIGSNPHSLSVIGNVVTNNTAFNNVIDGVSVAQTKNTFVYGNFIYDNLVQGISVEGNNTEAQILSNIVFNNSIASKVGAGGIIVVGNCSLETSVISNVVFNNYQYGILVAEGANNTTISNNKAYNNGQKTVNVFDGIRIATSNNYIERNTCFDDQINKTQRYGITECNGYFNNIFVSNSV